ncbi:MAG: hypothetical protein FJW21_10275 [Acidimicrobiia bacterium]|nr:hypothetical protein [Acidimicrobiia bacterium]
MPDSQAPGSGRETRLLRLVIVVAVAMLLVLAQFRYPAPDRATAAPVAGPIERLAARATFEELALIMSIGVGDRPHDHLIQFRLEGPASVGRFLDRLCADLPQDPHHPA